MVTIGVYGFDADSFLQRLRDAEDDRRHVGKRSRQELASTFAAGYIAEILDRADLAPIMSALPATGTAALFCVEEDPRACHRSLIAQRLADRHGVTVENLRR